MTLTRRIYSLGLIAGVAVMLGIGITGLLNSSKTVGAEHRRLASIPAMPRTLLDWQSFPEDVDAWARDRFGLRRKLVKLYDHFTRIASGKRVLTRITRTKEGWSFLTDKDSVTGAQGVASPELLQQWRQDFFARRDWLAAKGIKYLLVIVPDKHTIYPEYAPSSLLVPTGHPSRLDRILEALGQDAKNSILDLRPTLKAAKAKEQVYYQIDAHWNRYGAYLGYQEIMNRIQTLGLPVAHPNLTRNDFVESEFIRSTIYGNDMVRGARRELKDRDLAPAEPLPCEDRLKIVSSYWNELTKLPSLGTSQVHCPGRAGRTLVVHDSFTLAQRPYYASAFAETTFVWMQPSLPMLELLVDEVKPTLVIEERVEQFFGATYSIDTKTRKFLARQATSE